ncbi:Hypothetical predicted protein [Mytilus galloprovincialis]|uniref:Uncharacterized protein n=1 Tax=Mytilus galloprovincialis TaxID=29158 RepID=A0A8B6DYE3_MYTGA|nr:Hypothetical predicted protein [Mytilus galloprovincialis]
MMQLVLFLAVLLVTVRSQPFKIENNNDSVYISLVPNMPFMKAPRKSYIDPDKYTLITVADDIEIEIPDVGIKKGHFVSFYVIDERYSIPAIRFFFTDDDYYNRIQWYL